jgi:hypothetical protein
MLMYLDMRRYDMGRHCVVAHCFASGLGVCWTSKRDMVESFGLYNTEAKMRANWY